MARGGRPRVVDFSIHFSGPIASRQLAQLGADVIKFENPVFGDHNRQAPPVEDGISPLHYYINAGTRSLAISSKSPAWLPAVEAAAKWADVAIVGNRPAAARRMGIDLASLLRHNPNLVYCLITGYGMEGKWADYAAHGLNMDALAGVVAIESRDGYPVAPAAYRSYGTTLAGLQAAIGILDALYRRSLGQGGQFVHTSCWEAALGWMWRDVTTFANLGRPWDEYMNLGSRYSMYWTSDRRALLVCPIEKHFWERFCDAVGIGSEARGTGHWKDGVDFGRGYDDERAAIAERLATRTLDQWQEILAQADVPFAPILTWIEALESDHAAANGVTTELTYRGKPIRAATTPLSITPVDADASLEKLAAAHRDKGADLAPPPILGEHSVQILEELGVGHLAAVLGGARR